MRLKQHDTAPSLRATITDNGAPVDLTPTTGVKVIGKRNGTLVFSRAATTATNLGVVTMSWQTGDTALPGLIAIEIELTWPDATVQTIPPNGYLGVLIDPDLG
jgi:hypothetical protein